MDSKPYCSASYIVWDAAIDIPIRKLTIEYEVKAHASAPFCLVIFRLF